MPVKAKENINDAIRVHCSKNLGWLAEQIGMSQGQLSKKLHETKQWKQDELDKVNKVLGTSFKL